MVAEYITNFLAPLATKHSSVVKDIPHSMKELPQVVPNQNSLLYTNKDPNQPDKYILDPRKTSLENKNKRIMNNSYTFRARLWVQHLLQIFLTQNFGNFFRS